jgi:hypothetical protein
MKISRNYDAEHLRNLDFTCEADWQRAVAIFEDRLELDISNTSGHFFLAKPAGSSYSRSIVR